eukprot:Anaeramoba_flamelloidesc42745_g1_i8.p3 GENE.c42745_g1_i8~~c42745_g1_i8.p3  ORF type:complete len:117 (-),score=30.68 c42745_g1_i8:8-358(-)
MNAAVIDQEELELFREMVLRALEREVAPYYEQWEKDEITPRELWRTLGEAGLLCVDAPEAHGGCGVPFEYSVMLVTEMARLGYGALATNVMVHSDIVAPYVAHIGNDEDNEKQEEK